MSQKFKLNSLVQWKWLGRSISGQIKEIHITSITRVIKGKSIKRNGTIENPAYLVLSDAGNFALKLQSELQLFSKEDLKTKKIKPKLFT